MTKLANHHKMTDNEWCMKFEFATDDASFFDVHVWFDNMFDKDEAWMGWRSDYSNLTVFFGTERAYVLSLLRGS